MAKGHNNEVKKLEGPYYVILLKLCFWGGGGGVEISYP